MRYGIALRADRVAPRCAYAESLLMVARQRNGVRTEKSLPFPANNLEELYDLLVQNRVDALVCGGITSAGKEFLRARKLDIIDNVACTAAEIVKALKVGKLKPGYGLNRRDNDNDIYSEASGQPNLSIKEDPQENIPDCLACNDRVCLRGEICPVFENISVSTMPSNSDSARMSEAAIDIACERERTLCRLSELIYFCLEMDYKRLGVAYCIDLEEPADILVRVLRRYFDVFPICCRAGRSHRRDEKNSEFERLHCNSIGQAEILNSLKTDFNVMVGIGMGADCLFSQESQAPSTMLFVKDRSLANNPIGAVYSEYYLNEAMQADIVKRKRKNKSIEEG